MSFAAATAETPLTPDEIACTSARGAAMFAPDGRHGAADRARVAYVVDDCALEYPVAHWFLRETKTRSQLPQRRTSASNAGITRSSPDRRRR